MPAINLPSKLTASVVALYDMQDWSEAMANEGSDDAVLFRAQIVRGVSNGEVNQNLRFRYRSHDLASDSPQRWYRRGFERVYHIVNMSTALNTL